MLLFLFLFQNFDIDYNIHLMLGGRGEGTDVFLFKKQRGNFAKKSFRSDIWNGGGGG